MTLSSTAARILSMVAPALMMGAGFGTTTGRISSSHPVIEEIERVTTKQPAQKNRLADATEARILRMFGGFNTGAPGGYRKGPGWSNAQVQRMARKKRNQARNKRAHRG